VSQVAAQHIPGDFLQSKGKGSTELLAKPNPLQGHILSRLFATPSNKDEKRHNEAVFLEIFGSYEC
jgi:hypothetical protein